MEYDLKDFATQVIDRSHQVPVMVDFWAPWCGPCKMLGPVLESMAGQAEGRWDLVKINTEDHPEMALEYGITGIPDVRLFRNGAQVAEFKGMLPEPEIVKWLRPWLPSPREAELETARARAEEGRLEEAVDMAAAVLETESDNERLRMELAEWELRCRPASVISRIQGIDADSDHSDKAEALRALATFLASPEQEGAPAGVVKGREALRQGDAAGWIEGWLEALESDRGAMGGHLLEAGKAAFRFLGPRHPVAEANYRRFTFLLY
jgi:putative thioredoxin